MKSGTGTTPLAHACMKVHLIRIPFTNAHCYQGHLHIIKFLFNVGASVNGVNVDGRSPIHFAAHAGFLDVINYLLDKNAKLNIQNYALYPAFFDTAQICQTSSVIPLWIWRCLRGTIRLPSSYCVKRGVCEDRLFYGITNSLQKLSIFKSLQIAEKREWEVALLRKYTEHSGRT